MEHAAHCNLSPAWRAEWADIAASVPHVSPFQLPEFADVALASGLFPWITRTEDAAGRPAFLATEPVSRGIARPLAGAIADVHGFCGSRRTLAQPRLLEALGAGAFLAANWQGEENGADAQPAFLIELPDGYSHWRKGRAERHGKFFKKLAQRERKATRECGTIRIEIARANDRHFKAMKEWKRAQYHRAGKLDVFSIGWVERLLLALSRHDGTMRPVISALYIGDQLAAVEFGLRHARLYHSWFPAYNPHLSQFGPGHLLLDGLIRRLADDGVTRIDLGVGAEHYKEPFANASVMRGPITLLRPGWAAARVSLGRALVRSAPEGVIRKAAGKLHSRWAFTAAFAPTLKERTALMAEAVAYRLRGGSARELMRNPASGQAGRRLATAADSVPSSR